MIQAGARKERELASNGAAAPSLGPQVPADRSAAAAERFDLFISYSRRDSGQVAPLVEALEQRGKNAWVDLEDIRPTAEWWEAIRAGIDAADNFVFVLSPDSVASDVCANELAHAASRGKRMIPLLLRAVERDAVAEELAKYEWISFEEPDFISKVIEALDTDLEWVVAHTRLLVWAVEWDRSDRDRSLLLRGRDLKRTTSEVERHDPETEPAVVILQRDYLAASAQLRRRNVWRLLASIVTVVAVAVGLGTAALTQTRRAETEARASNSVELATASSEVLKDNVELSLMLALAGVEEARTPEAVQALAAALKEHRGLGILGTHEAVEAITISPDSSVAATSGIDGVRIWPLVSDGGDPRLLEPPASTEWDGYDTVAFSDDSTRLLAAEFGTACVWEVATASQLGCFTDEFDSVHHPVLNPDGSVVAAPTASGVRLFEVDTGDSFFFEEHEGEALVERAVFSRRGQHLLVTRFDGTVVLHDLPGNTRIVLPPPPEGPEEEIWRPTDGFFSPGDEYVLVDFNIGAGDHLLATYNLAGELLGVAGGESRLVHEITFDRDGRYALAVRSEGSAQLYEVPTGQVVRTVTVPPASSARLVDGGPWLVVPEVSAWVFEHLWDDQATLRFPALEADILATAVSPDGALGVAADRNGDLQVYDLLPADGEMGLAAHTGLVDAVAFAADGGLIGTGGADAHARVWDAKNGRLYLDFELADWVYDVIFVGDRFVALSADGRHHVWDHSAAEPRYISDGHPDLSDLDHVSDIAVSSSEGYVATVATNGSLQITDIEAGDSMVWDLGPSAVGANVVGFAPDGSMVAVGDDDGQLHLVVVADGSVAASHQAQEAPVMSLLFHPDGTMVLAGSVDGTAKLIDLTGEVVVTTDHQDAVTMVDFAPDTSTFATSAADGTVTVWSTDTGEMVQTYADHNGRANEVHFSADGGYLVSAGEDGTARIYDLAVGMNAEVVEVGVTDVRAVALDPKGSRTALGNDDGTLVISRCVTCGGIDHAVESAWKAVPGDFTDAEIDAYFDGELPESWRTAFDRR